MAEANFGVVGQAQLNMGMAQANGRNIASSPMNWSVFWFVIAVGWILTIYFGFGGLRGSVAS